MESQPLQISKSAREKKESARRMRNLIELKTALKDSREAFIEVKQEDVVFLLELEGMGYVQIIDPVIHASEESWPGGVKKIKLILTEQVNDAILKALAGFSPSGETLKQSA